ncbi:MAG TPA: hypothetical protein VEL74_02185, partial [Thermoanaerobaculia bacterium]|nr:hypothetical protein [Thermoanaerobaculia bacterium]
GAAPLRVESELITAAGGVIDVFQEVAPGQTVAVVNQPADRFQTVLVTFQDPLERWDSVHVELERAPGEARRVLALSAVEPSGRWSAERPAGAPRTFRYHTRQVGRDGALRDDGWKEAAGSLLLVGDPDVQVGSVQVILLGPPDLMAVQLRLVSLAPPPGVEGAVETLIEPGQPPFQARLPFRRGAERRYRVEGQVFLADGERQIDPRDETAEVLLLQVG